MGSKAENTEDPFPRERFGGLLRRMPRYARLIYNGY